MMPGVTRADRTIDVVLLVLDVDYLGSPDLHEVARILDRLADTYSQQFQTDRARLAIDNLYISSLIANLKEVIDGVSKAFEAVETLSRFQAFINQVAVSLEILKSANGGVVPETIRALIAALIAPLKSKEASNVVINIYGKNDGSIVIGRLDADKIEQGLALIENVSAGDNKLRNDIRLPDPIATESDDTVRLPGEFRLSSGAELRQVGEQWYADTGRYAALLPVVFSDSRDSLRMDRSQVEGAIEFDGALPVRFRVRRREKIRKPSEDIIERWVGIPSDATTYYHPNRRRLEIVGETESGHRQFILDEELLMDIDGADSDLTPDSALRIFREHREIIEVAAAHAYSHEPNDRIITIRSHDFHK